MSDLVLQLNARWRLADDPPQWTLETRSGDSWRARAFVRDRDHLLKLIAELCGKVNADALAAIRSWPKGYVSWKIKNWLPQGTHASVDA